MGSEELSTYVFKCILFQTVFHSLSEVGIVLLVGGLEVLKKTQIAQSHLAAKILLLLSFFPSFEDDLTYPSIVIST